MRKFVMGAAAAAVFAMAGHSAMADDYYALGADFSWPGNSMSVDMSGSSPQLVRIFGGDEEPHSAWTQSGEGDWFKIHVKSLGAGSCLTLVPHVALGTIAAMAPCVPGERLQDWRSEEAGDSTARLYNAGMAQNVCLTQVSEEGEYYGYVTMTTCGEGDVATEIWHAKALD